jgi:hypothetical protein
MSRQNVDRENIFEIFICMKKRINKNKTPKAVE